MKKSILVVAVLSVFAFSSCKDNAADKVNEDNVVNAAERDEASGKFPVITFEENQFDFGAIDQGTRVEHLFKFKNTGDAPLTIVDAKSSCGCTVPQWTREAIKPGEEGELLVKFDGSGQNQVNKTITVISNTEAGTQSLTIKAFVTPKNASATPVM